MIKEFEINNFKKFKFLNIKDLNRINIFLGNNNVGKTTLLEAIFALASGNNLPPLLNNSIIRYKDEISIYNYIEQLLKGFHNDETAPFKFKLSAKFNGKRDQYFEHTLYPNSLFADIKPSLSSSIVSFSIDSNTIDVNQNHVSNNFPVTTIGRWEIKDRENLVTKVNISFPLMNVENKNPLILGRLVDILAHRNQKENLKLYSYIKRDGLLGEFNEELSKTFPDILNVDLIPYPDGSIAPVSLNIKNRGYLPLNNFGDGIQRWFHILGGMIAYKKGIHCIEEIDATFHPNAQKDLAHNLYNYSKKYDNQLFITCHSIEFVDNFLEALYGPDVDENNEDIVRIITLKNMNNDATLSKVLSGIEAFKTREKYQMELR
ncbi:AAA family ATPase [Paenibacillus piri]|uniref:ATPase AAA-type core domain-containing protein n=1 Tax=Paenibacillus piri TaxID=2547395 RepID=A0A4R5KLY9_9BACL|nr:ATP-binding protein [Paenibacillus piri]TDF96601.1 hypothetical protein E1757_16015 [Paenibacillus piri]